MDHATRAILAKIGLAVIVLAAMFLFKLFSNPDFRNNVIEHFQTYSGRYAFIAAVIVTALSLYFSDGDGRSSGDCFVDWDGRSNSTMCN